MDKSGRVEIFFQDENFFLESRIFFSSREYFFFESRIFSWSREFFHGVENLVIETIIFTSCRDYFCRVENYFFESNSDNQSRFFSSSRDLFVESKIFSLSREYPTCHAVSCRQNDQTIWRICSLRSIFIHRCRSSSC